MLHPTGSLYGLAVDAHNAEAISRLKELKNIAAGTRPFVVIILAEWVEDLVDLKSMSVAARAHARRLAKQFWPGGLTLIVPASKHAPREACAITDTGTTLAIRADDHPAAVTLCEGFGGPLISTSANLHGSPSPLRLSDVPAILRTNSALLDIPPAPIGSASTVLDLTASPPKILREGRVPASALR